MGKKALATSVEVEEVDDDSNHQTSIPPRNPQHILEAADGSDDNEDQTDDDDEDKPEEAPQESAEAELSTIASLQSESVLTI